MLYISVQFELFIYTQIIAHDVHYRFEVVIGDDLPQETVASIIWGKKKKKTC